MPVRVSGWQMCNLTTINGTIIRHPEEFFLACVRASVIGTLQAAYTDMPYLGPVTRRLNEGDALLGVSVCGFMDNPGILLAPRILERGARICRATNQLVAAALGLRPAARVTCVKPEGTASLLLNAAAGIHPRPARHYFRRVHASRGDPVYERFRAANPHMVEIGSRDDVLVFPVEAPAHAVVREQLSAVDFLAAVLRVQRHWVLPGEAACTRSPGLHHNVSHTCAVQSDEWPAVREFIWRHRGEFAGLALLGAEAEGRYAQPPFQPVVTDEDAKRWNQLRYHPVNYSGLTKPTTTRDDEGLPPCLAGACEG